MLYARNAGQHVIGKGNGSHVINTMKYGFAIVKTYNYLSGINVFEISTSLAERPF